MKVSLQVKTVLAIVLMCLLVGSVAIIISYTTYANTMDEHYKALAVNVAKTVSAMVDGDKVQKYVSTKETDDDYDAQLAIMEDILVASKVESVYILEHRDAEKECFTILDPDLPFGHIDPLVEHLSEDEDEVVYVSNTDLYGWMCSSMVWMRDAEGHGYAVSCADISMNDVMQTRHDFLIIVAGTVVLAMIQSCIILVMLVKKTITKPINQLAAAAKSFVSDREGENEAISGAEHEQSNAPVISAISRLEIHTGDEIEMLADSIKTMEKEINEYIDNLTAVTAEKERIGAELDVATKIQSSMLPCIFPAFSDKEEFDIYATMNPAKEVGGDFYDFFMIDDKHLAIVVADVSGKGIPAALFMVIGKTLIKDHTQAGTNLGEVFSVVNDMLCEANSEGLFITAFEGVLNLETGEFEYVNAGHEIPFICKPGDTYQPYKIKPGFVLAGMEGMKYKYGTLKLEPGARIFQYTDGVTEATNIRNELYGMDRLSSILDKHKGTKPTQLLSAIREDIDQFVGEAPQFDDITMLCLEYKGWNK